MAWEILCMDCDFSKTLTLEEKNSLKKCPKCGSESIQIYDNEKGKGAHCAGTINPSSLK